MNVKIEKQEKSKVVLEFTMPKDDFNKALDKAFAKNAKHFKVPGFRNGKVPRNVVEKVYGEGVLYESVIEDTVDEEYRKALEENKLEPVSRPEMDVKQIGKDKDFIYTVSFYVKPEAKVSKYKGLEIEKVDVKVSKEDVEAELESVRNKNAEIKSVEDRKLQQNDISTIDFEGFVDGVAFEGGKGENFELTIGSGQFIPGFEDQLVGMEIGEEREIKVTFPKEYHAENLAGKDSTFKVKLISIKEKILPELDDEFAKDVSEFETLEEYKKDLKAKVKERKENQAKAERESKAIEKLVENVEVEIPEAMIEHEIEHMIESFAQNLSYQGMSMEQYLEYTNTKMDDFKESLKPNAIKDIKLRLALEFINKAENVVVEDKEIDEKLEELSKQYGSTDSDSLKKNESVRNYMREKLIQDKTMALVVDSVIEK